MFCLVSNIIPVSVLEVGILTPKTNKQTPKESHANFLGNLLLLEDFGGRQSSIHYLFTYK